MVWRELAEFVLGKRAPVAGSDALAEIDGVLDRSHLMPVTSSLASALQPDGKTDYNVGLEH